MRDSSPALAVLVALLVAGLGRGQVCSASAFGPVTHDPITISGAWTIGNNCTLNFGFRHVILDPTAALTVTNATLLAGQLTVQAGATIGSNGIQGSLTIATIPGGTADGSILLQGAIDLSATPAGGTVMINAGTSVSISGSGARVHAHGASSGSGGGSVSILAPGMVMVDGQSTTIDVHGFDGHGGSIAIQSVSSSVTIQKALAASGQWQGGTVTITSGSTLTTTAVFDASASAPYVWPAPQLGQGGSISLHATTDLSVSGDLQANISGLFNCGGSYGVGGAVTLQSGGSTTLSATVNLQGGGLVLGSVPSGGTFTASATGNYTQAAGTVYTDSPEYGGSGGTVSITAGGTIDLFGSHVVSTVCDFDVPGNRGLFEIHANGHAHVVGSITNMGDGFFATPHSYAVLISSATSEVTVGDVSLGGLAGSTLTVNAATDITINGSVSAQYAFAGGCCSGWNMSFVAGGNVTASGIIHGGLVGNAVVTLTGCRVTLQPGSIVNVDDQYSSAGTVTITARDLLTIGGTLSAISLSGGPDGSVNLKTRLSASYSPILAGSTITPSPAIIHDKTLLPCLALGTASLSGPSPLNPGDAFVVNLDSLPSWPVVVLAGLSLQHLSLAAYGWTQVNPDMAAILADPGALGPPVPGSTTDGNGQWGISIPTTGVPGLSGLTIYVEAYVIDPNAVNGLFHQPPYLAIQFL